MPAFTYHYTGKTEQQDGSVVPIAPRDALFHQGPIIQVEIGISSRLAQLYTEQNLEAPPPKSGHALLDTGASHSCIDTDLAQELKLPLIRTLRMATPSHAGHDAPVYSDGSLNIIAIGKSDGVKFVGASLKSQNIQVLIGRDILSKGVLIYNGFHGSVVFAI